MNEKLTLPAVVKALAASSGRTKKQCDDFLRELFAVIADSLAEGQDVAVRGLGSFRIVDVEERKSVNVATGAEFIIAAHKKVSFTPAPELASSVNYAFEMFEPVEVAEEIDDETLSGSPSSAIPDEGYMEEDDLQEEVPDQEDVAPSEVGAGEAPSQPELQKQKGIKRCRFCWGVLTGFVAAVILMGAGLLIYKIFDSRIEAISEAGVAEESIIEEKDIVSVAGVADIDSVASVDPVKDDLPESIGSSDGSQEVDTRPSDTEDKGVVRDVITTTRYLTTVAREHYGNDAFWPYIYEENKDILGHPDRIRPGTSIVVPSLSKYGVDTKNPEHIKTAKRKGVEIYARYRK